jgi:beta-phosphoglucomutase
MIEAIFFDFNGVIIDDEPLQLKAAQTALQPAGVALTDKDYYDALGMDDVTFIRFAFARAGHAAPDEATLARVLEQKTKLHRELIKDELPFFPGIVTFIKAAARHFQLGLVSMARRADIEHVLERAHLTALFAVVVSAEDVRACKPDPACYAAALARLNEQRRTQGRPALAPAACLVIEDAPPGIQSARTVGMCTIGVTNTVKAEALRAAGAEVVTARLSDWTVDAVRHLFDGEPEGVR